MWKVSYQLSKKDVWRPTSIRATTSQEAWAAWTLWRILNNITDYYAVCTEETET